MCLKVQLPKNGSDSPPHARLSLNLLQHSPDAVIQAAYRRVFGREVFATQRQTVAESQLKAGEITVREFIRQLAKTSVFRQIYWEPLLVTKAIEYIHRRLLGRPTWGRREIEPYYDCCSHQGFYGLIDAIVNSAEYSKTFGEDMVPYERYLTPRGYEMRSRHRPSGTANPRYGDRVSDGTWVQQAMERVQPNGQNGHGQTSGNGAIASHAILSQPEVPKDEIQIDEPCEV